MLTSAPFACVCKPRKEGLRLNPLSTRPSMFSNGGTKSPGGDSGLGSIESRLLRVLFPLDRSQQLPQPRCPHVDQSSDPKWRGWKSVAPVGWVLELTPGPKALSWYTGCPGRPVLRPLTWAPLPSSPSVSMWSQHPRHLQPGGPDQERCFPQSTTQAVVFGAHFRSGRQGPFSKDRYQNDLSLPLTQHNARCMVSSVAFSGSFAEPKPPHSSVLCPVVLGSEEE